MGPFLLSVHRAVGINPTALNFSEVAMCQHLSDYAPGSKSWGDDVPGYAQGCFYPGDEPGCRCRITGELCDPDFCPLEEGREVFQ